MNTKHNAESLKQDPALTETVITISKPPSALRRAFSNWSVQVGGTVLIILILMAIAAPLLSTISPQEMDPANGNAAPLAVVEFNSLNGDLFKHEFLMGSDSLGRDIWSRTLYGARISIAVGIFGAAIAVSFGMLFGLLGGYFRHLDGILMRIMDGVMAIPSILFAICLVASFGASLPIVVFAIAIPQIPSVARLVRSAVLSIREEPFIEAAISLDTPTWKIITKHILPNSIAPLIIQATYVCATSILVEAALSFLGVGMPADVATWGNIMADGRAQFNEYPHSVLFPGVFLALTVLSVNILGDGLRDTLDPKFNKRGA